MSDSPDPFNNDKGPSSWIGLVVLLGAGAGLCLWAFLGWDFYFIESFLLAGILAAGFLALVIEFIRALWKG